MANLKSMLAGSREQLERIEANLDAVEAEIDEAQELCMLCDEGWGEDLDDNKLYEMVG